jgi:hypothetical protein
MDNMEADGGIVNDPRFFLSSSPMTTRWASVSWVVAGMALALVLASRAPAEDVVGIVTSVDVARKRMVVRPADSDRDIAIALGAQTVIVASHKPPLKLADLRPGMPVIVNEHTMAAQIVVEEELVGRLESVAEEGGELVLSDKEAHRAIALKTTDQTAVVTSTGTGGAGELAELEPGTLLSVVHANGYATTISVQPRETSIVREFWENFRHNLFKPLLMFFYAGFLIPLLKVKFDFPYVIYQALTLYLLIAIGWHGGEELALLPGKTLGQAVGFMGVGFVTNSVIGILAYLLLRSFTDLRRIDAATVGGYYGSDSAGTFVTCLGVLAAIGIKYQAYMPVLLAVMEIPGCLVALFIVSRLRRQGMDPAGTMPDESGFDPSALPPPASGLENGHSAEEYRVKVSESAAEAIETERELALEKRSHPTRFGRAPRGILSPQMLHEVFLNPGIYLLFVGIVIGYVSRRQGARVAAVDDPLFLNLFQGLLCLFLLEMGMTASRKLKDLRSAGWRFVLFGLAAPNLFATIGIAVALGYSHLIGQQFDLGTYVLFSVLCAAASYIAVPAIQRLAIPEASPTLPLAASLGLTFSYNVTVGIPLYIQIAKVATRAFPV